MSTSIRTEHSRPAHKNLARLCLQKPRPEHVRSLGSDLYAIDLPADVGVIGFVHSETDYWFTWYPTKGERDDALGEMLRGPEQSPQVLGVTA